jgi:mannose-1-phosphate guanylyltransferase
MIHVVIMAGGSGTRFWPLSRKSHPKQFLKIGSEQPLLYQAAERVLALTGWERLMVVASGEHARPIRKILPEMPKQNLILEPRARNTAPAIALAALEISMRDPDGIMIVLPSDHVIRPAGRFRKLLRAACSVARSGSLVTLGVTPRRPETGFGYIRTGRKSREMSGYDVFEVDGFEEKPDLPEAIEYLQAGNYYWNSGMFVFSTQSILSAFSVHMPKLYEGLQAIQAARKRDRPAITRALFDDIRSLSIDYGIMEKASNIQMLPCDLIWSDVGSWAALPEVTKRDASDNVISGDILAIDSQGCVIQAETQLVACVGLRDMIVVETPGAILVCPLSESQTVRRVVDQLRRNNRLEVL